MSLAGILTPQANTTVEAEMRVLLHPGVAFATARLTCPSSDSRERLLGYFNRVHETLAQFDVAPLEVAGFACTGSTYLVGLEAEARAFAQARVPVISAAGAVVQALEGLKARRIALLSPYPAWLTEACIAFWRSRDVEVVDVKTPAGDRSDTRRIYALGTQDALDALAAIDASRAQAILISGTGMPSLGAIARSNAPLPVISSNLCLAWRLCDFLRAERVESWIAPDAAWRARVAP
jgi:maleate isomerase